jgi:hypothetical protein
MGMVTDDFGKWGFEVRSESVIIYYGARNKPAEIEFEIDIKEIDNLYEAILDVKRYLKERDK